jgi:hypothetical protein
MYSPKDGTKSNHIHTVIPYGTVPVLCFVESSIIFPVVKPVTENRVQNEKERPYYRPFLKKGNPEPKTRPDFRER